MDRGTRTAAASARRVRFQFSGMIVLVVLAAGGLYLARGVFAAPMPGSAAVGLPADVAVAVPPAVVTIPPRKLSASPAASMSLRATGSITGTASSQPAASAAASASTPAEQDGTAAAQVLALINQGRATAGLPALTV